MPAHGCPARSRLGSLLVEDTWTGRDLPVLDATVALLEQSFMVTVTDIAARTGFEPADVATALEALDPSYVDFRKTTTGGDPRFWYVYKATPEARRVVGQWPTAEALASRLAEELATAATQEPDAERRGLLTYAARLIGDTLRDATVRAAGRALAPAFGGVPAPELGTPLPEPEPAADQLRPLPEADLPIHAAAARQQGEWADGSRQEEWAEGSRQQADGSRQEEWADGSPESEESAERDPESEELSDDSPQPEPDEVAAS
jgi:hypothetical protein